MRPASSRLFPWYDSSWLAHYVRARDVLREVGGGGLARFDDALRPLRTRPDFEVVKVPRLFGDAVFAEIRAAVATLTANQIEAHEARGFGRFVVHNHPFFTTLQETIEPLVAAAVGEPVEGSYNFLSLYGKHGVCRPHMDSPEAKWTVDLCVAQNVAWPIHFSQVVPWPDLGAAQSLGADWENRIRRSPDLTFTPHELEPGEAIVFSGSSQWHYRDAIPARVPNPFCDLLFFHFIPKGMGEVIKPANWPRLFNVPSFTESPP